MKTSIFIRTYHADIKWLNYCLKSIHKNLTGWDEIIICIPENQKELLSHLTAERVVTCKVYSDDYIGQQISKLQAYKHCKNEAVLFVDSDVVFFEGAKVSDYFNGNKPVILKNTWDKVDGAIVWKPIMEKLFGEPIKYEYMRRAPQLFLKSTLENFAKYFPDIEKWALNQPHRAFTEFNFLGYFVEKNEATQYDIIDLSKHPVPTNKCKQFWSWSGLTSQERDELENITK